MWTENTMGELSMDKLNIKELYNSNADLKTYIDKYCKKNNVSVDVAFNHSMVIAYTKWMREKNLL